MKAEKAAGIAWVGLIVSVAAYDYYAPDGQTLSEGVDRALQKHPLATTAAIGMTAMHLMNIFEHLNIEHLDPIHQLANIARNKS